MEKPYIVDMLRGIGQSLSTIDVPVQVRRLDDFALAPTAIKIDAEGAEWSVLRGAEQTLRIHRPVLLVENGNWGQVTEYLASLGYKCFRYTPASDTLEPFYGQTTNAIYLPE